MAILSVPSWVIPGTYAENLRFLENKKQIQGVELLFFMYDEAIKKQFEAEWEEILGYGDRFTFTAHLPELLLPAHEDLVSGLASLACHFIIHPDSENPAGQAALLRRWTERYGVLFLAENIYQNRDKNRSGGPASGKDVSSLEALLPHLDKDAGLCMDTGHLLLEGQSPSDFFRTRQKRIREIHLHDLDRKQAAIDGRLMDHRRLREDEPWLLEMIPLLKGYQGIVNLEVFSWEEAEAGIKALRKLQEMS